MITRSGVTLTVSMLLFTAASVTLFLYPAFDLGVYPVFGLIFLWNDFRRETETHVIFVFLMIAAGFLLMARAGEAAVRMAIAAEAVGLWLLSFGLGAHREHLQKDRYGLMGRIEALDANIRDSQRELKFYQAYEGSAVAQAALRKDLTSAAKSLGNTMDPQEVTLRLTGILEGRYKDSKVRILPGQPDDPIVSWALRTRMPVVVRDMHKEERFGPRSAKHSFRSALVVPLNVMKRPYGFVRLESSRVEAYSNDDLRTVDLVATMASLTLENIQLHNEVNHLASTDALTQLFTQRVFRERLKEELLRAGRSQTPLSVIMADIDYFKKYNDTFGHQAGDELLRTLSRILAKHTRPVDCVARCGGEEFGIVLPNMVRDQAVELANRMRIAVQSEPFMFQGRRTSVTMSFGVAAFPQDATSQSQLVRAADEKLYRSKSGGRNKVTG